MQLETRKNKMLSRGVKAGGREQMFQVFKIGKVKDDIIGGTSSRK